jgi:hypothetical protein
MWLSSLLGLIVDAAIADQQLGESGFRPVPLESSVVDVQPMTGIVLWGSNEEAWTAPIQLEFSYLSYDQVVRGKDRYDWQALEEVLEKIAGRGHQAIIRWHDTYVGRPSGVPDYLKARPGYRETVAQSEGQPTGFPDWSHPDWQALVLDFFTRFSEKYDQDPRIAFVQVGFGLWAEYHIYDGPMELGRTFPSKDFQSRFFRHLAAHLRETPWMISVDAAGDHAPFRENRSLLRLKFGLFDDSFNHARHQEENEPNWNFLGRDRWKRAPVGGEFSFFEPRDQVEALSPTGPHGIPFSEQAANFHTSFMIGDDQPRFRTKDVIRKAGMRCGYRFKVTEFAVSPDACRVTIENSGIAPIYYDAFPAVNGIRSSTSLKGLLPGETKEFMIPSGGGSPVLTIECDRLVRGQRIDFDANLR